MGHSLLIRGRGVGGLDSLLMPMFASFFIIPRLIQYSMVGQFLTFLHFEKNTRICVMYLAKVRKIYKTCD
jgi:hypothetical protein